MQGMLRTLHGIKGDGAYFAVEGLLHGLKAGRIAALVTYFDFPVYEASSRMATPRKKLTPTTAKKDRFAALAAKHDMQYVAGGTIPRSIKAGKVLVHNHIQHEPDTRCAFNGFRAWWTSETNTGRLMKCKCGWAGLPHYRVRRSPLRNRVTQKK